MDALVRQKREALLEGLRAGGLVDEAAIARAEVVAARTGQPVEQVLNQLGALSDDDLVSAYAEAARCEVWDPGRDRATIAPEELSVTPDFLKRRRLLPLRRQGRTLVCAVCDPLDEEALSGLTFALGGRVSLRVARPADFGRVFAEVFERGGGSVAPVTDERRLEREIDLVADSGGEGAGARLVASVFEAAIEAGASDIHFEPRRHDLRIRLRVDGQLVEHRTVSADLAPSAVSRVKVIANLNLGERRLPQDGRTTFVVQGRPVDVRVATSPTVFGESAVLRILDRAAVQLDLDALGLGAGVVGTLRKVARSPHGLFLVTGPTGSGKTTTLYALLQTFAGGTRKVLSVEDPVEYHFDHVAQTQVAPGVGLTFAAALRSFLRQDPDVILVGEIRDPETAAVAIQAALTGHFVLASVHANDAFAVVPRLLDMGIEPYQLAAGLRGAAAQRLVRRLCEACASARAPDEEHRLLAQSMGLAVPSRIFVPQGCPRCSGSGFKGRTAIAEAFLTDETMLRSIADRQPPAVLAAHVREAGFMSMMDDGRAKAELGETTLEEVLAAVNV
ncbi:GspE/PulE family protein [Caulobacter mirabilis]|uniref:Secretion system protein E n=1 Tax=Caulobacter mirabilis TaxID=69666 RepID=A0A2D2AZK8_9CAUL|nr:type II/IV secretion system protein [Caulobacter mirabilis]ATQ43421.1 secretion system protein E [Caulobacter mirabilis]